MLEHCCRRIIRHIVLKEPLCPLYSVCKLVDDVQRLCSSDHFTEYHSIYHSSRTWSCLSSCNSKNGRSKTWSATTEPSFIVWRRMMRSISWILGLPPMYMCRSKAGVCWLMIMLPHTGCKVQGLSLVVTWRSLSNAFKSKKAAFWGIGHISLHLVAGLSKVQVEHNSNNEEIYELESPPLIRADMMAIMYTSKFIDDTLDPHLESYISQFWHIGEIEMIEEDHQKLRSAFNSEVGLMQRKRLQWRVHASWAVCCRIGLCICKRHIVWIRFLHP